MCGSRGHWFGLPWFRSWEEDRAPLHLPWATQGWRGVLYSCAELCSRPHCPAWKGGLPALAPPHRPVRDRRGHARQTSGRHFQASLPAFQETREQPFLVRASRALLYGRSFDCAEACELLSVCIHSNKRVVSHDSGV